MTGWIADDSGVIVRIITDHYGPDPMAWPDALARLCGRVSLPADHQKATGLELIRAIEDYQRRAGERQDYTQPTP